MLKIAYKKLDDLIPYDKNPRTHDAAQIAAIERSLAKFGWVTPVGVADGVLTYGHARRQAAINLRARGIAIPGHNNPDLCPTVDLSRLSETDRRAYVIADNALSLRAGWDSDLLRIELGELQGDEFDLSLLGFEDDELTKLFEVKGAPDDFDEFDESIETEHQCPKCGYVFSGGKAVLAAG